MKDAPALTSSRPRGLCSELWVLGDPDALMPYHGEAFPKGPGRPRCCPAGNDAEHGEQTGGILGDRTSAMNAPAAGGPRSGQGLAMLMRRAPRESACRPCGSSRGICTEGVAVLGLLPVHYTSEHAGCSSRLNHLNLGRALSRRLFDVQGRQVPHPTSKYSVSVLWR